MNTYNLGGHSGCQILLIEDDNGNTFVRKFSKDSDYNPRLKVQCEKQASFQGGYIKTPKVLNSGMTEDGLFYFDMEYVQGITLAKYIQTMEIGKVKGLVSTLVENLVPKSSLETEENQAMEIFSKKIKSLKSALAFRDNKVIQDSLELLEKHDWSKLTPTQCHGDMTLENIIVKNDTLYFIDFLDSFYDSWFLDIGTLLQDVQVMWSYRFQRDIDMNTVLRLIVFRDLLLEEIKKINADYVIEIYYSLLQKLIRIYPYTKDELTYEFLNKKTSLVLDMIHSLEQNA
ncbi:MAG: phosphotransferase [Clostridia bacterium]|nr:phosphotransferase [Clostridia bacterium]